MATKSIQAVHELIARLLKSIGSRGSALQGKSDEEDFFEKETSMTEIFDLFDRSEYILELKKIDGKDYQIKDRIANKSPTEFMAGLERDIRASYCSRLDNYRSAALSKQIPGAFFGRYQGWVRSMS